MDDWAEARALLAGDMEGGEPSAAAQHLPVLHHPSDPETAQLQSLGPPIRTFPLKRGEALPGLGAGRLCAPVLPAFTVGSSSCSGSSVVPAQTEVEEFTPREWSEATGEQRLLKNKSRVDQGGEVDLCHSDPASLHSVHDRDHMIIAFPAFCVAED